MSEQDFGKYKCFTDPELLEPDELLEEGQISRV